MSSILKSYIRNYINEATSYTAFPPEDINANFQSTKGFSSRVDKTNLSSLETLTDISKHVGPECFISFIDPYDENIPALEINPKAAFNTPHGNYAYPFTIENMRRFIEGLGSDPGPISNKSVYFATDRDYFHLFKTSNMHNKININADGTTNYVGDLLKDVKTLCHTAIIFLMSKIERSKYKKPYINYNNVDTKIKDLNDNISDLNQGDVFDVESIKDDVHNIIVTLTELCNFYKKAKDNQRVHIDKVVKALSEFVLNVSNSEENRYQDSNKENRVALKESNFHKVYFCCFYISKIMTEVEKEYPDVYGISKGDSNSNQTIWVLKSPHKSVNNSNSVYFSMLLNSIDIDAIEDKGSLTIHKNEPVQAVFVNTNKKVPLVHIGTYNNIFDYLTEDQLYNFLIDIDKQMPFKDLFDSSHASNELKQRIKMEEKTLQKLKSDTLRETDIFNLNVDYKKSNKGFKTKTRTYTSDNAFYFIMNLEINIEVDELNAQTMDSILEAYEYYNQNDVINILRSKINNLTNLAAGNLTYVTHTVSPENMSKIEKIYNYLNSPQIYNLEDRWKVFELKSKFANFKSFIKKVHFFFRKNIKYLDISDINQ